MTENALPNNPGFVVLGRAKTANAFQAIVEHSWCMDLSMDRACFFWSPAPGDTRKLDPDMGRKSAEKYRDHFAKSRPDHDFVVYDIADPALPVKLFWDEWRVDNEYIPNTLSGVRNKFKARNVRFDMLDEISTKKLSTEDLIAMSVAGHL